MIKLFNIATNLDSQDRLLYDTAIDRDTDFNNQVSVEYEATNFERIDDMTFAIDVFNLPFNTSFNYAIYKGYYLFIKSAIEKDINTTRMILKLDTITQYLIKENIDTNKEVYIKRTHLDRFKLTGQDEYMFNFDNDELLIKEDLNIEPSVIDFESVGFDEFAGGNNIKWLAISFTDGFQKLRYDNIIEGTEFENINFVSGATYFIPLVKNIVHFYDITSRAFIVESLPQDIIINLKNMTTLIDAKIIAYTGIGENMEFELSGTDPDTLLVYLDSSLLLTETASGQQMIARATQGYNIDLLSNDIVYTSEHKPTFTLQDILTKNYEPKLFQFKKYELNYLQNNTTLFYDSLRNENIVIKMQKGIDYTTDRLDFFVESGLHKNAKNTGPTLTCISDNTIAVNISQWAEYVSQKKSSSSNAYAYGLNVVTGGIGAGIAGITTGGLGAGVSIANSSTQLLNTRSQRKDIKQSPDKSKTRGSNIINDVSGENTFQLTVTKVKPLDVEIDIIEKYLFYNGYKLGSYKNLLDIIDTRVNFNYVELLSNDNILTVGVSNNVLQDILSQLNNGIRLYKSITKLETKELINNEKVVQ